MTVAVVKDCRVEDRKRRINIPGTMGVLGEVEKLLKMMAIQ